MQQNEEINLQINNKRKKKNKFVFWT